MGNSVGVGGTDVLGIANDEGGRGVSDTCTVAVSLGLDSTNTSAGSACFDLKQMPIPISRRKNKTALLVFISLPFVLSF